MKPSQDFEFNISSTEPGVSLASLDSQPQSFDKEASAPPPEYEQADLNYYSRCEEPNSYEIPGQLDAYEKIDNNTPALTPKTFNSHTSPNPQQHEQFISNEYACIEEPNSYEVLEQSTTLTQPQGKTNSTTYKTLHKFYENTADVDEDDGIYNLAGEIPDTTTVQMVENVLYKTE